MLEFGPQSSRVDPGLLLLLLVSLNQVWSILWHVYQVSFAPALGSDHQPLQCLSPQAILFRKLLHHPRDPGAWAGCVVRTEGGVFALVSEDKWLKAKAQIMELEELLDTRPDDLPRKRLEQIWGFLGYVTQTYRYMTPYLNGLHMGIDGWRDNRDDEG